MGVPLFLCPFPASCPLIPLRRIKYCVVMSLKIDRVQLEIIIQQDEARQKMIELEGQMRKAKAELKNIKKQFGENSNEYKAQEKVVQELQTKYDKLFEGIGIGKLSLKELTNRQRELNAILRNLDPSLPEWKEYNAQLQEVNARIKELKGTATETRFSLSKMADGFNKYAAMGASAIATMTGVAMTARKCVDEYAEMEEAEAQVIKYTGMTREEVKELNEEFKRMDTRTAREKLNALAGDAGRLGITGKKDVLEFVDAADKINVALGEDLGEDAVKNIGKLAQMFGEDKKMGLRGAMLATGSAVNEVAQNSSAAEAYLVGFTARVAGAANQAKVAQGDILGYASVLDQNMQQQEMAATAFQTLMMKMYQEPAKFAGIAGKSVEEFTLLIKNDANEAILQFLETLNKKGGLDRLAPMFKEMGLDGVRASGVISTMAGKIDDIRAAQKLANDAYRDGTSIIKENNVQNNTVQAGLDKAKNHFKDVRVELGEKLLPVMKYMVSTGSLTVKGLSAIISILFEYKGAISGALVVMAGWTAAKKADVAWSKLQVFWTDKAVVSLKALAMAVKSNPWGALATGGIALAGLLLDLKRKQDSVTESTKAMNRINTNAADSYKEQSDRVRILTNFIRNENLANEQRKKYLQELKSIIPEYNGMLDEEGRLINDNTDAIEDYLKKLEQQIKLKAAQEELEELYRRKRQTERQLRDDEANETKAKTNLAAAQFVADNRAGQASTSGARMLASGTDQGVLTMQSEYDKAAKAVNRTKTELNDLQQAIEQVNDEIKKSSGIQSIIVEDDNKGGGGGNGNGEDENALDKELKAREVAYREAYNAEVNILKEKLLNEGMTEEAYRDAQYKSEMDYLLKRKTLLESYGKDASSVQGQIYDKMIAEANRLTAEKMKTEAEAKQAAEKNKQSSFSALDESYKADQMSVKQAYLDGDIRTEEEYRKKLLEVERDYLEQKRAMQLQYGDDTSAVDGKLLDMGLSDKKESKEKQREQGFSEIDNTSSFARKNDILRAMYDADLITYEEYQEEKSRIAQEQEQWREDVAKAAFDTIGQAAAAAGQVVSALQDAEISKVTRKYDKQIKAAKKAGKDTTKLEEEKEEAINQVKKKYADKQFAASVLQVTASTAVAAMEAYKAMAGIPIVGPALGAVAAAAAIASGAAQIAVAKQQRDEAKGLKSGGYLKDYVEGYTKNGNPDDVAGVIPVHKNEFVTNHEGVANPHVRQFLDVFDVAQRNGTIRMLNTTQILEQVRTRSGKYAGGYSETDAAMAGGSSSISGTVSSFSPETRLQIVRLLIRNNELLEVLTQKELVVDSRKIRDGIKRIETLESNVSR